MVGDNGIITNAQNAKQRNERAVLEEFLQQKYVECYSNGNYDNKVEMLKQNGYKYFYEPTTETGLTYVLDSGYIYYLVDKTKLPKDIADQLGSGNCGIGKSGIDKYNDFATFQDVYGVTTDLKVYYCSDGLLSSIGAVDEKLKDDAKRTAISSGSSSGLASFLSSTYDWIKTDESGNILAEGLSSLSALTIENKTMNTLEEFYNFSTLTTLTIRNATIDSLSGLQYCSKITDIYIYNSTIGNYSVMGELPLLKKLYLENVNQSEATNLTNGLASSTNETLEYFGIYNSLNVTDLSGLNTISSTTRAKIRYLYLYMNGASDITLNGYDSLYELNVNGNSEGVTHFSIESLSGNMPKLAYLYANYCPNLSILNITTSDLYDVEVKSCYLLDDLSCFSNCTKIEWVYAGRTGLKTLAWLENSANIAYIDVGTSKLGEGCDTSFNNLTNTYTLLEKSTSNALYALRNKKSLYYLSMNATYSLAYVSWLKDCTALRSVHFKTNPSKIPVSEINELSAVIQRCGGNVSLPPLGGLALADSSTVKLYLENITIKESDFERIVDCSSLKGLRVSNCFFTNDSGVSLTKAETNTLVNTVLGQITSLECVSLSSMSYVTDITFVQNCPNITQLDVRWSNVSTHKMVGDELVEYSTGLELLNTCCDNLTSLMISHKYCDYSCIQAAISKCNFDSTKVKYEITGYSQSGLVIDNATSIATFSKCTTLETLNVILLLNNLDLSNCGNLRHADIRFYSWTGADWWGSQHLTTTITLPDTLAEGNDGYDLTISGLNHQQKLVGGLGCKSLTVSNPLDMSNSDFWNALGGFRNSTVLECVTMKLIKNDVNYVGNAIDSTGLSTMLNGCTNLKEFYWYGNSQNVGLCRNISFLSDLTNIETIYFDNTCIDSIPDLSSCTKLTDLTIKYSNLTSISGIRECSSLVNITFYKNSIFDLSPLFNLETEEGLSNLETLDLRYNKIKNIAELASGDIDNVATLNGLRNKYNKLTTLYISNNLLTNTSGLNWAASR